MTRERLELLYWKALYQHVSLEISRGKYGSLPSVRTIVCNVHELSELQMELDTMKVALRCSLHFILHGVLAGMGVV